MSSPHPAGDFIFLIGNGFSVLFFPPFEKQSKWRNMASRDFELFFFLSCAVCDISQTIIRMQEQYSGWGAFYMDSLTFFFCLFFMIFATLLNGSGRIFCVFWLSFLFFFLRRFFFFLLMTISMGDVIERGGSIYIAPTIYIWVYSSGSVFFFTSPWIHLGSSLAQASV